MNRYRGDAVDPEQLALPETADERAVAPQLHLAGADEIHVVAVQALLEDDAAGVEVDGVEFR